MARSRGGGLAVIRIEIPLSALGLVIRHQQPGLAPHQPIEKLHPQLSLASGPGIKFGMACDKPRIGKHNHWHGEHPGPAVQHRLYAPLTGLCYPD